MRASQQLDVDSSSTGVNLKRTPLMLIKALLSCVSILVMASFSPTGWAQETKPAGSGKRPAVTGADAAIFFKARDWARAAEAYSKVVASNPHDGQNWANYAFSLYSLKRYDEAIKAFEKQGDLGFQPATATYNIACSHSLAGRKPEALAALEKAIETGFDRDNLLLSDSDLDSLRGDPRFKKLLGTAPLGLSREERWAYDLDYLMQRMEKLHYRLHGKVPREKLWSAVNDLKGRVGSLKDEEIAVGVQGILAMVGDGHTIVAFERRGMPARQRYPVELELFQEGLFVRSAPRELAEIAGCEVVTIGRASAEEALRRWRQFALAITRWGSSCTVPCI